MMNNYILLNLDCDDKSLTFLKEEDAVAYQKAFDGNWKLIKTKHITHLNAQNHIVWDDIPNHLNFIYRDHNGVFASQYKPKSKWFTGNNKYVFLMYGGERLKLDYNKYHELIKLGDVFENKSNNRHFINWNKVKKSYAIKFIDNNEQTIEIFNDQGELIVSGSNDELNVISKNQSFQFGIFPWQTYTFIKT